MALPAIRAIRMRHPEARIVLLTDRHPDSGFVSSWDVVAPTGWVDAVQYYEPKAGPRAILRNAVTIAKILRTVAPTAAYMLQDRSLAQYFRDWLFLRVTVPRAKRHFPKLPSPLPRRLFGQVRRAEPEWKRLLAVADHGAKCMDEFSMPASAAGESEIDLVCQRAGLSNQRRWLAVAPGSKMPAKVWPVERYAAVGRMLIQEHPDLDLVILGGAEDISLGDNLCVSWSGRGYNLAGRLSIQGAAALLRRCVGYLGNDTGTMHLAATSGIRCVALFSARDRAGKWEPIGHGHAIIRREVNCAGCMLEICLTNQNKCLSLISVDEVVQAVNALLSQAPRVRST